MISLKGKVSLISLIQLKLTIKLKKMKDMFVHISPDIESYSETKSTLEFAERVSGVELGVARSNKEVKI